MSLAAAVVLRRGHNAVSRRHVAPRPAPMLCPGRRVARVIAARARQRLARACCSAARARGSRPLRVVVQASLRGVAPEPLESCAGSQQSSHNQLPVTRVRSYELMF